jgi:NtrC-family two-component system response regulator AlgB
MNVLIIDNDKPFCDAACLLIEGEGLYAQTASSVDAGLALLNQNKFHVVFLGVNLDAESGLDVLRQIRKEHAAISVVVFSAASTIGMAVEAMRLGAADFLEKPFAHQTLLAVISRLKDGSRTNQSSELLTPLGAQIKSRHPDLLLDFSSPAMRRVMEVISRAAKSSATILIHGESGTGKTVLARTIHEQSHLADKPFVTVSCPSLSRELLESEFFGHVKGSFTGAFKDHWGKVKAAAGGTLFLDEIGDLPIEIQPKLLRLLQEQEYERLGENITRNANIRVIAATNCDLKKHIEQGLFREDLYFRLNVISVEMPPLRSRPNDLLQFANHYLCYFAAECGRKMRMLSKETLGRLQAHSWPGNVRELRNAIQRAVVLAKTDEVTPEDLSMGLQSPEDSEPARQPGDLISIKELEETHMRRVLERTGSIVESARVLGIDPATIYRRRREWSGPVAA